jgi:hypothetical protein
MDVDFKTVRRDVVGYFIVLLVEVDGKLETIRVYESPFIDAYECAITSWNEI